MPSSLSMIAYGSVFLRCLDKTSQKGEKDETVSEIMRIGSLSGLLFHSWMQFPEQELLPLSRWHGIQDHREKDARKIQCRDI